MPSRKLISPVLAVAASLALIAPSATAQCFEPAFGTPAATASQLTGDVVLPIMPIGFAFPLGGTTYSDMHLSDKGMVYLSNAGVPAPGPADFNATAAEFASGSPRIAPLWSDLQLIGANGAMIYVDSTPSRCVITWENVTCYQGNCDAFTMQAQLMPSGEVFFFYGVGATNNSDPAQPTWQVGVSGISPGSATLGAMSDLSVAGVGVDDLIVEEFLAAGSFDMAGTGLHFIPTLPGWVYLPPAGCATARTYGEGCVEVTTSIYENFVGTLDLSNTTLTWLRGAQGYTMLTGLPGTFVTPGAGAVTVGAGGLDADELFALSQPMPAPGGPISGINVTTKGNIELINTQTGNVDWTPTVTEFLAWPNPMFACWHDYNQTTGGQILFEEVGGVAYATWLDVNTFGSTNPNRFQFQLTLATGDVALVIETMTGAAAGAILVGYTSGTSAADPGPSDLSVGPTAFDIFDAGQAPLAVEPIDLPVLGSTTFGFEVQNVPNLVPLAFLLFGDTAIDPGVDLGFLGMPGCNAHTNANLTTANVGVALPAGTGTLLLPIPATPSLVGASLTTQALAFSLLTPANLITSNGLEFTVGN